MMPVKISMKLQLSEWEANYLLEWLDEQADYDFRGPDSRVVRLRDRLQERFDKSGWVREHFDP